MAGAAASHACVMGVIQRLRAAIGDDPGTHVGFGVGSGLQPPPVCGQWYAAVGNNTATTAMTCPDAKILKHTVSVCVTCKYAYAPQDRQGLLAAHSFDFSNMTLGIAAEGRDATVEEPDIQPNILEVAEWVADLLLEDYVAMQCMNLFLGQDKWDEVKSAAAFFVDVPAEFCEPFHEFSMGGVQSQSATWLGGEGGFAVDGDIQTLTVTLSGALSVQPTRYMRGLDRFAFTT